jgi:hypothetical protein
VWFSPGIIHRAVNDGGLEVIVVMQNAGLPEAGDAVLTLPPAYLADPERYAAAVRLSRPEAIDPSDEPTARGRRDLAVEGFGELRARFEAEGPSVLDEFYAAAHRLVAPKIVAWEERWREGPLAAAQETGLQLAALTAGDQSHLSKATVHTLEAPAERFGMCGRLSPYDPQAAATPRPADGDG